jgi:hypothetical protein
MNSSANQISPINHTSESPRAWPIFFATDRSLLGRLLGFLGKSRPGPAACGLNMPSTGRITQGGKLGIRRGEQAR